MSRRDGRGEGLHRVSKRSRVVFTGLHLFQLCVRPAVSAYPRTIVLYSTEPLHEEYRSLLLPGIIAAQHKLLGLTDAEPQMLMSHVTKSLIERY